MVGTDFSKELGKNVRDSSGEWKGKGGEKVEKYGRNGGEKGKRV